MKIDMGELQIYERAMSQYGLIHKEVTQSDAEFIMSDAVKELCQKASERAQILQTLYSILMKEHNENYDVYTSMREAGNPFPTTVSPITPDMNFEFHIITNKDNAEVKVVVSIPVSNAIIIQYEMRFKEIEG